MSDAPLLEVSSLVKTYRSPGAGLFARKNARPALAGVSFSIDEGRSFGIVGESGSGKSTLARIALALDKPELGRGAPGGTLAVRSAEARIARNASAYANGLPGPIRIARPAPAGRKNRRRAARGALADVSRAERRARVQASLEAVGLSPSDASKYPHEFSGGQRQRIAIARALITRPKLVVADEPVSALDVSVQAQTLNLMSDLEREAGVTFLLISHDLAVVAHICVTTAVLYRGRIVEIGDTGALFANPAHPYTRELVDATPRLDPDRHREGHRASGDARLSTGYGDAAIQEAQGALRSPGLLRFARNDDPGSTQSHHVSTGGLETNEACPYAARCAFARPRCLEEPPVLEAKGDGSGEVACWYPLD